MDINLTVTLTAVFATVGLVAWMIGQSVIARSSPTRRRIDALARATGDATAQADPAAPSGLFNGAARRKPTFVPLSPKSMGMLQRRLTIAGYHHPRAVELYLLAQVALVAVLGGLPLLLIGRSRGLFVALLLGILGYMAPGIAVDRLIAKRRRLIENGLPDALDMLIVSLEAGLGLDQAILKSSEELMIAHPELAEELRLINVECRAGKPRIEALKNFASRTKVDDVRALVAMLVQTDRFGTSVAQALRTHAEVSRTKRRQRAEERAAKIGVKLVFPLVFCLFPAFFVVTIGPAIIKFVHAFGSGGFATGAPLP
jgi:tight adherence protein C